MAVFELILCIIAAVVVSSFVSRFVPKVSTPLVQIVLGVLVYTAPVAFSMGASQTTSNIWKSWCRMLGGQIFLLIMNAWCLRLFTSMVGSFIANPLSL